MLSLLVNPTNLTRSSPRYSRAKAITGSPPDTSGDFWRSLFLTSPLSVRSFIRRMLWWDTSNKFMIALNVNCYFIQKRVRVHIFRSFCKVARFSQITLMKSKPFAFWRKIIHCWRRTFQCVWKRLARICNLAAAVHQFRHGLQKTWRGSSWS